MSQPELFSVYQFFKDGSREEVRKHVSTEEAMKAAQHYTTCVTARMGITVRVIIVDMLDCIVFEWLIEHGVVFPEQLKENNSLPQN